MGLLNSFGSVMSYAIQLEAQLTAYYQTMGNDERARESDKRRVKLERIRRENIVEITLEPIDDLDETDFTFNWQDTSAAGQKLIAGEFVAFYRKAAPKLNVLPAQRALERCGQEHQAYLDE
jgi:hypothetical protein